MTLVLYNLDSRRRFTPIDNSVWWVDWFIDWLIVVQVVHGHDEAVDVDDRVLSGDQACRRPDESLSACCAAQATRSTIPTVRQERQGSNWAPLACQRAQVALGHATHDSDDETHYSAPLLTIHRTNMLEDGYRQLGTYSTQQLKVYCIGITVDVIFRARSGSSSSTSKDSRRRALIRWVSSRSFWKILSRGCSIRLCHCSWWVYQLIN